MDLSDPGIFFSGLIIGLIGLAIFIYGRKSGNYKCVGMGVVMGLFPYFVSSVMMLWGVALLCLLATWLFCRQG